MGGKVRRLIAHLVELSNLWMNANSLPQVHILILSGILKQMSWRLKARPWLSPVLRRCLQGPIDFPCQIEQTVATISAIIAIPMGSSAKI